MKFHTILAAAAASAALLALEAATAEENCRPQVQVDETYACVNGGRFTLTLANGTIQYRWCQTNMSGKIQSNDWYRTSQRGPWDYSYTTTFDCSTCEWEIRRGTNGTGPNSFYDRYCGS